MILLQLLSNFSSFPIKIYVTISDNIECRADYDGREWGICNQMMEVGFKPMPPENFTCISENWQSLNCTWDVPYNPIQTVYELAYFEDGSGGR